MGRGAGAAIHATIVEQHSGNRPTQRPTPVGAVEEINVNAHSLGLLLNRTTEANGRVQITARDLVGGKFAETEIFLSAGLSPAEIESFREFVASVPVV